MKSKIFVEFCMHVGFGLAIVNFAKTEYIPACGLTDIDPYTSPSLPYVLPPIADNLGSNVVIWKNGIYGQVTRISAETNPHSPYLTASFSIVSNKYWLSSTAKSKNFVKDQNTREMIRYITLHCSDGTSFLYHFKIPVHDMSPPVFTHPEYTFPISSSWPPSRPISNTRIIQVCDNAAELAHNPLKLRLSDPKNLFYFVADRLGEHINPKEYCFRVEIFLKERSILHPGQKLKLELFASDQFYEGRTLIHVNVSE